MSTPEESKLNYQLLGRLQQDCDYYLGDGNRAKTRLWAGDEASQIAKMKELYAALPVKPEWLTMEHIEQYEAAMITGDKMNHPYTAVFTYKSKKGPWPAIRGEIYERDVRIGTFSRGAVQDGYIPEMQYKFFSEAARNRFDDFADSLTVAETIEALLPESTQ